MKYYTITVNGTTYDVAVEETSAISTANSNVNVADKVIRNAEPKVSQTAETNLAKPEPERKTDMKAETSIDTNVQQDNNLTERVTITAPMPGKILEIKGNPGDKVKRGDVLFILEAMKMENEIVSPEEGTLARIAVTVGNNVESGDLLATLN